MLFTSPAAPFSLTRTHSRHNNRIRSNVFSLFLIPRVVRNENSPPEPLCLPPPPPTHIVPMWEGGRNGKRIFSIHERKKEVGEGEEEKKELN